VSSQYGREEGGGGDSGNHSINQSPSTLTPAPPRPAGRPGGRAQRHAQLHALPQQSHARSDGRRPAGPSDGPSWGCTFGGSNRTSGSLDASGTKLCMTLRRREAHRQEPQKHSGREHRQGSQAVQRTLIDSDKGSKGLARSPKISKGLRRARTWARSSRRLPTRPRARRCPPRSAPRASRRSLRERARSDTTSLIATECRFSPSLSQPP